MLTDNLQNVRIMKARLSLNPTNGSVESIAWAVGYPDRQVNGREAFGRKFWRQLAAWARFTSSVQDMALVSP